MSEWWSYGLSDFLMFSPQVYWRMVARHNMAAWPAQLLALAAAGALPVLLRTGGAARWRLALGLLALAWAWTGWSFHWRHYADIFLGAPWLAAAFALEALLLLLALACRPAPGATTRGRGLLAWTLLGLALLYPLLAPLAGRPWAEAEVFGLMPEPTALATLGVLAGLATWPAWSRWVVAVLPVLSLLLGAATRWLLAQ
jgi:hypothetical protein